MEGGQEVSQAAYLAYESSRPVTGTASKGAALFRKKAAVEAKKRIKKVEAGKKQARETEIYVHVCGCVKKQIGRASCRERV